MLRSRLTLLYFGAAIIAGIFVACSGNANDESWRKRTAFVVEEGESDAKREKCKFDLPKNPYSKSIISSYKALKKSRKRIVFFTQNRAGIFFLVVNRDILYERKPQKEGLLFGLLNEKGKQLLPLKYEKIGNPGMIAVDYMELKKEGKYGLYDYVRDTVIAEGYDVIFPSPIMGYVAIGERKGKRYRIYEDGSEKPFEDGMATFSYVALISSFKISSEYPNFGYWIETQPLEDGDYELGYEGTALVQMPSYIDRLEILPQGVFHLNMPWMDMNSVEMTFEGEEYKERSTGAGAMITGFFSMIGEGRPTEINKRHLLTFDQGNRLKSSSRLLEWNPYDLLDFYQDEENSKKYEKDSPVDARFLNDSVVEARDFASYEGDAIPYSQYTRLTYYVIHKDGSVTKPGDGLFPMASSIELKPEHFKGYFIRHLRNDEVATSDLSAEYQEIFHQGYDYFIAATKHLSTADLDYMEMEIYARHGLKFSDVKWKGVFTNVSWYKAKVDYDAVQKLLTPIEKKNIALMQKIRKKILTNPESYIKEKIRPHAQAG